MISIKCDDHPESKEIPLEVSSEGRDESEESDELMGFGLFE